MRLLPPKRVTIDELQQMPLDELEARLRTLERWELVYNVLLVLSWLLLFVSLGFLVGTLI